MGSSNRTLCIRKGRSSLAGKAVAAPNPDSAGGGAECGSDAYVGVGMAKHLIGMGRLYLGLHLLSLQASGEWRGRSGASSFRRFILEEGLEPVAVYQYMAVAKAFVVEGGVAPERIAKASFRVMAEAAKYLVAPSVDGDEPGNVEEIVSIVTSLPSAEAYEALRERFEPTAESLRKALANHRSRPVSNILGEVDKLTHEQRAELYAALRVNAQPRLSNAGASTQAQPA